MSRIITIGREFGSGGREVGRRLATAIIFNIEQSHSVYIEQSNIILTEN